MGVDNLPNSQPGESHGLNPITQQLLTSSSGSILTLVAFEHIKQVLEKFNDGNHFFIIHQTIEENAIKILQSPYFSQTGLNGTVLISNLDGIINACYHLDKGESGPGFQLHKSSNSLVIMIISKEEFISSKSLPDIDNQLGEYVEKGEINKFGLPNRCVWGYVRGPSFHTNQNFSGKILGQ